MRFPKGSGVGIFSQAMRNAGDGAGRSCSNSFSPQACLQSCPKAALRPRTTPIPRTNLGEDVTCGSITYDSVMIHYQAEGEEPFTVDRVIRFVDSFFPGSGRRALQVIDDPQKGPVEGIFNVELILVPLEEISHITLRKGEKETIATVEEVLGETSDPDI